MKIVGDGVVLHEECEHEYSHLETKQIQENGHVPHWIRIDYFFCVKCLDEKEKRKSETNRYKPEWY